MCRADVGRRIFRFLSEYPRKTFIFHGSVKRESQNHYLVLLQFRILRDRHIIQALYSASMQFIHDASAKHVLLFIGVRYTERLLIIAKKVTGVFIREFCEKQLNYFLIRILNKYPVSDCVKIW